MILFLFYIFAYLEYRTCKSYKNNINIFYYYFIMNTLKDISSEFIRQNWLNYKDEIYNSPYYESLWNSLESKFEIEQSDIYFTIFKKFINNEEINYKKPLLDKIHINQVNNETLILKGLDGEERRNIHLLCDKIGLHHESKPHPKKNKRY